MFFFLLFYIYTGMTLLLMFIQDNINILTAMIDTYVYVLFGALSVDTSFKVPYSAIVLVTGTLD